MNDKVKAVGSGLSSLILGPAGLALGAAGGLAADEVDKAVRTGASAQERKSKRSAKEQQKREKLRLAEATDEVERAKSKALSSRSGRQSLIRTSPSGLATKLGGT